MKNIYLVVSALGLIWGCGGGTQQVEEHIIEPPIEFSNSFSALPTVPLYPESNPYSLAKEKLGELLFWDPILSGNQNVACASCHHPDFAWADGRRFSIGVDGIGLGPNRTGSELTSFNSPTILNNSFTGLTDLPADQGFFSGGYFWDLRVSTLEEQAIEPLKNPIEMLGHSIPVEQALEDIELKLKGIPEYESLFNLAFGSENSITIENIAKALATFQRKLTSHNSRFDQYMRGDLTALTEREISGLNNFIDAGCARCHTGVMLSDNLIHDERPIVGNRMVRTPTLRNIALTSPYMHNGSISTLREAVDTYDDREDLQVQLEDINILRIIAFLETLTDDNFYKEKPISVPSGLNPGGNIN